MATMEDILVKTEPVGVTDLLSQLGIETNETHNDWVFSTLSTNMFLIETSEGKMYCAWW